MGLRTDSKAVCETPLATGCAGGPLPTASCTSPFRRRPDESAARVHRGKRGGHPPVRPSHHAASRRGPLPLTGGVRAASGPQRRPAGGETYSKQNSSFRSGFAAASRLRLAAEGGAEGAEGDRTVPVRRSAAKRQQGDHARRAWWKGRHGAIFLRGRRGRTPSPPHFVRRPVSPFQGAFGRQSRPQSRPAGGESVSHAAKSTLPKSPHSFEVSSGRPLQGRRGLSPLTDGELQTPAFRAPRSILQNTFTKMHELRIFRNVSEKSGTRNAAAVNCRPGTQCRVDDGAVFQFPRGVPVFDASGISRAGRSAGGKAGKGSGKNCKEAVQSGGKSCRKAQESAQKRIDICRIL